jgi:hypothetical protein
MSTREALLHELEGVPEPLLSDVLDFVQSLRRNAVGAEQRVAARGASTLEKAAGLLKTGAPAPSDEQVRQWLEEERVRKHG